MDFNFTEEQDMVRDGLSRLVREQYDWEARREAIASEAGWRPEIWAQLAELGILGMPFSEDVGGFGGGAIDAMIVMEEFGKGLVVEPFVPTVVCAGGFLAQAGTDAQREEHLSAIIDGSRVFAFAYAEPRGRYDYADLETTAKKDGNGNVLNGHKAVVIGAQAISSSPPALAANVAIARGSACLSSTSRPTASSRAITKRSTGAALRRFTSRTSRFPPTR